MNHMDKQTLELIAEFICGDSQEYPIYRTGWELTRFFQRVGFSNFIHDGSTRKWWTLSVLEQLSENNLRAVILRLADPREYRGNREDSGQAMRKLNEILGIEGLRVELDDITPKLKRIPPQFSEHMAVPELKPLSSPDFVNLKLEPALGEIFSERWNEIQRCKDSCAYLAATILMGSLLEGLLLAVLQKYPAEANKCTVAPKDGRTGQTRHLTNWSLSEMINVCHNLEWIDLDVKKFSHSLRDFRNLIHPYQQMISGASPDKDTCDISWLVVQAASNDLARKLK